MLLGGAALVIIVAGVQGVAWLIGPLGAILDIPLTLRSRADTELAAAPVPSPKVEESGPPSREPTTRVT